MRRWLAHFPRDRFLILDSVKLQRDPVKMFSLVVDFLEVPNTAAIRPHWQNSMLGKPDMPAAERDGLRRFFELVNAQLRAVVGLDFHWS